MPGLVPQEPAPEGGEAGRLPTSAAVSLQLVVAVGQLAMGLLEGRLQRHVLQDDSGQESSAGALWKGWWTQSVALWKGWWTVCGSVKRLVDTVCGSVERLVDSLWLCRKVGGQSVALWKG